MRWEDERYVRLYTRDTLTWKLLGWQGRAVLPQLFRKVDRAGVLDIGEMEPGAALAVLLDMPHDLAEEGWKAIARTKSAEFSGGRIIVPNFIEAQEATTSDAERKRKSRELARVTIRDISSQPVTSGHETGHLVTNGHERSQSVTPSLAVPSRAEPEKTLASPAEKPAGDAAGRKARKQPEKPSPEDSVFVRRVCLTWPWVDAVVVRAFEQTSIVAYPAVDLVKSAAAARAWEQGQPKSAQKRAVVAFLGRWFAKEQASLDQRGPALKNGRLEAGVRQVPDAEATAALIAKLEERG